jgi:hypothetical protein
VELAALEEITIICKKWQALRPEERWWLYSKTSSEAALAEQKDRGWRKALYCALSDGTSAKVAVMVHPRQKRVKKLE